MNNEPQFRRLHRPHARHAARRPRGDQHGVTLIELMIVLGIAAILLALAVPSFQDFVIRNRLSGASQEMLTSLQLARSESIRRGVPVTLRRCKPASGLPYETANWRSGWTMWAGLDVKDIPEDCGACDGKDPTTSPCNSLVRRGMELADPLRLVGRGFNEFIAFGPNGGLTAGAWSAGGEFVVCQRKGTDDKKRGHAVLVNAVGRVRMALDANNDGKLERDDGQAVDVDACIDSK